MGETLDVTAQLDAIENGIADLERKLAALIAEDRAKVAAVRAETGDDDELGW